MGFTQYGAQRAELKITSEKKLGHTLLSRGKLKILMCVMRLAQGEQLYREKGRKCIYLVDDIASELDGNHMQKLVQSLADMQAQVFVTGIEKSHLEAFQEYGKSQWFHVEHGRFSPVK